MPRVPQREQANGVHIGIDPGASGGIAVIHGDGELQTWPMPATEKDVWECLKKYAYLLGHDTPQPWAFAVVEWIHPAIQGIGKSPMSKLYGNYMMLRGMLTAAEIPYEVVQPRKWQKEMGIAVRGKTEGRTQWKQRLRQRAQQLFPAANVTLAVADAILIAEYNRRNRSKG